MSTNEYDYYDLPISFGSSVHPRFQDLSESQAEAAALRKAASGWSHWKEGILMDLGLFFYLAWGMMTHSFFHAHLDRWKIGGSWWILVGGLIWDEAVSNDPRSCSLSLQRWNRGSWGVNAPVSGNAIEIPPKSKQNTCPRNNVATNKSGKERERELGKDLDRWLVFVEMFRSTCAWGMLG